MAAGNVNLDGGSRGWRRQIVPLIGAAAGTGILPLVYVAVKSDPKAVIQLIGNWGPIFAFALFVVFLFDRRMGELIVITRDNCVNATRMADAMQEIAHKDDERAREQDLLIGELTRNSRMTLERMNQIGETVSTMSRNLQSRVG